MAIAQSTTVSTPVTNQSFNASSTYAGSLAYDGVPVDVYRMFNVDIGKVETKDIEKLKDICGWASSKCEEVTIGNIMQKISSLENQLGSASIGDKRWDKMWNWVKINKQIDDLKKRQESLRGMTWR